ncbi:hypothetical protein [Mesorhizobium sp. GR13]|uniref:hypothetical protein n=1 Tax=Mesorhizobium sp. GR13 TaxID=2562308 RepID=UPI0010C01A4C|nr:hypothetical protein [Mesorhizobium sp. GR13]
MRREPVDPVPGALRDGIVTEGGAPLWREEEKECLKERSLLAQLLPDRLTGASDELAETPKGERKHSMSVKKPKSDAAVGWLDCRQDAHGESLIA